MGVSSASSRVFNHEVEDRSNAVDRRKAGKPGQAADVWERWTRPARSALDRERGTRMEIINVQVHDRASRIAAAGYAMPARQRSSRGSITLCRPGRLMVR